MLRLKTARNWQLFLDLWWYFPFHCFGLSRMFHWNLICLKLMASRALKMGTNRLCPFLANLNCLYLPRLKKYLTIQKFPSRKEPAMLIQHCHSSQGCARKQSESFLWASGTHLLCKHISDQMASHLIKCAEKNTRAYFCVFVCFVFSFKAFWQILSTTLWGVWVPSM